MSKRSAIIQIENLNNEKIYIDYTNDVETCFDGLKNKLNKSRFKNIELQDDWSVLGEDNFDFSVLEYVERQDRDKIQNIKKKWIMQCKSHHKKRGYNNKGEIEISNWEIERELSRIDEGKWNDVHIGERDLLTNYNKKMDKELEFSDDRIAQFKDMDDDITLVNYISSDGFSQKQTKLKSDFLSETAPFSKSLQSIAYYLLFADYKNEKHKQDYILNNDGLVLNNVGANNVKLDDFIDGINQKVYGYPVISKSKFQKDKYRILYIYDMVRSYIRENESVGEIDVEAIIIEQMMNYEEQNRQEMKKKRDHNKNKKYFKVETGRIITKLDLQENNELIQRHVAKKQIGEKLGYGKSITEKEKCLLKIETEYGESYLTEDMSFNQYVRLLERVYKEISGEMIFVKEKLLSPINFKSPQKSSGVYDYDYSLFNFSDIKQVGLLLKLYSELKERHFHKFNDIWAIIMVLDQLVSEITFTKYESFILEELMSDAPIKEITDRFNHHFHKKYNIREVRRFIDKYIPQKIVNKYIESKDDYLFYVYHDFLNPQYKTCSKCREQKLALPRYFSPDIRMTDGLRSICNKCR